MSATESLLLDAYDAAVAACDPELAVAAAIRVEETGIHVGEVTFEGATASDVALVAIGKAASAMVRGATSVLGDVRGVAFSNHVERCNLPLMIGSHPVPDETSLACGEAALSFVAGLSPNDVVLYLMSGGGSSIAVAPKAGVSLKDLAELNRALMNAGVPIGGMNEIRASVSRIKGGGLAASCEAERSMTLVLSDVVGVGPSHVASGPSIGAGMGAGAARVVDEYDLAPLLPVSVLEAVEQDGAVQTAKPERYAVVGSSEVAAHAAAELLQTRGVSSSVASTEMEGEARTVARRLARDAVPGAVTIVSGETTVTVAGDGVGGRNQEGALAAAIDIAGTDTVFLACGTDGIDGATPAAGALVDGGTYADAVDRGIDLDRSLARNDSYTALAALDAVVIRGDTGTNVGDIWMIAKDLSGDRELCS